MKRFLLLFFSAVLCCSIIGVSVFAAELDLRIDFTDGVGSHFGVLPNGEYYFAVYLDGESSPIVFDSFVVTSSVTDEECFDFECSGGLALVRITHNACGDMVIWVEYLVEDVQAVGSNGYALISSSPIVPDSPAVPDPPVKHPDTSSFLAGIGQFFSTSLSWLGSLVKVITQSPALLVLNIGIVLILFVLGLFRRMKC